MFQQKYLEPDAIWSSILLCLCPNWLDLWTWQTVSFCLCWWLQSVSSNILLLYMMSKAMTICIPRWYSYTIYHTLMYFFYGWVPFFTIGYFFLTTILLVRKKGNFVLPVLMTEIFWAVVKRVYYNLLYKQ